MTDKNQTIIGFMAETFIHSGCGQSQGAIDLPFAREKATEYPYIPGSSLKGAFRDYARKLWSAQVKEDDDEYSSANNDSKKVNQLFGNEENGAGNLLISDLRLLLLPVRSLSSAYKWVTCPHIIARLNRDFKRLGMEQRLIDTPNYRLAQDNETATLFLEELSFIETDEYTVGNIAASICEILTNLLPEVNDLEHKLVIINNNDFCYFAKNALAIQARNILTEGKISKNLWYEESLPPDTVMYCTLANRYPAGSDNSLLTLIDEIEKKAYIQTGGNETVGMGWFQMKVYGKGQTGE